MKKDTILALIVNTLTFGLLSNVPVTIAILKGSRRIRILLKEQDAFFVNCACFGAILYAIFDFLTLGLCKWIVAAKGDIKEFYGLDSKTMDDFADEIWVEMMSEELNKEGFDKDWALETLRLIRK